MNLINKIYIKLIAMGPYLAPIVLLLIRLSFGWKMLMPLAAGNLVLTACVRWFTLRMT